MASGYQIDESRCTGCRCCKTVCPSNAIRVDGAKCRIDKRLCVQCGACVRRCPYSAVIVQM